jgi:hypothetical protein
MTDDNYDKVYHIDVDKEEDGNEKVNDYKSAK